MLTHVVIGAHVQACLGLSGRRQGDMMTEANAGEFGHGAHANEPGRATSIEQKLSNIATWFDAVLQDAH